jgi:hypothetical protein
MCLIIFICYLFGTENEYGSEYKEKSYNRETEAQ